MADRTCLTECAVAESVGLADTIHQLLSQGQFAPWRDTDGQQALMPDDQPASPDSLLPLFGLSDFRAGQREVIDAVLADQDCLCIMPTGGGKSLCFQLPSVMRDGATLVISPLIALMKDQVDSLRKRGLRAEFINSTLMPAEQTARMGKFVRGEFDLLYVAPERFRSPRFMEAVRQANVQLLAVDEAHCISEWGHDFRHDYARLGRFREQMGNPQTIALTATATQDVRQDVVQQLRLKDPQTFVAGFARPNLHYEVESYSGHRDKRDALRQFVADAEGTGIIYAATRKACEEIGQDLQGLQGRRVAVYHGGLEAEQRRQVQDQFMQGHASIVVATNAFGMGIDKSDVRFVLHYNMPGTLEAYYQEAGRAGRDGQVSRCRLLYSPSDRYIQEFFIESAFPKREVIGRIYEFLRQRQDDPIEITRDEVRSILELSISNDGVGTCERLLEKAGVLERLEPNRNMAAVRIDSDVATVCDFLPRQAQTQRTVARAVEQRIGDRRFELVYFHPHELADSIGMDIAAVNRALRELNRLDALTYVAPFRGRALRIVRRDLAFSELDLDYEQLEARRQCNLDKLQRVVRFATASQCRQEILLEYFGESTLDACGHCDNCDRQPGRSSDDVETSEVDDRIQTVVIKALSGVARSQGRFGKQMVAGMLCGSRSAKVQKWNLDKLSTFGVLGELTQTQVAELLDRLIASGLIQQSEVDRFRPVVKLTTLGDQVMRGKQAVQRLRLPADLKRRICGMPHSATPHASTPHAPAPHAPAPHAPTPQAARPHAPQPTVPQSSPESIVPRSEIGDFADDSSSPPRRSVERHSGTTVDRSSTGAIISSDVQPQHYWTWRLLHDGYTVDECVQIRRLDADQILDHALQALESGQPIHIERILPREVFETLNDLQEVHRSDSLQHWLAKLPASVGPRHVQLFRRWLAERTTDEIRTLED